MSLALGLSLLCSNIALLFYCGILPCYCCYSHASLAIVLKLCSFIIVKAPWTQRGTKIPPTGVGLSPLFILTAVTDGQIRMSLSLCWLQFDLLLWVQSVDSANVFAATRWFAHVPCY